MGFNPVQGPMPAAAPSPRAPAAAAMPGAPAQSAAPLQHSAPGTAPRAGELPRRGGEVSTFTSTPKFTEMAQNSRNEMAGVTPRSLSAEDKAGIAKFFSAIKDATAKLLKEFPGQLASGGHVARKPSAEESVDLRSGKKAGDIANKNEQEMKETGGGKLSPEEKGGIKSFYQSTGDAIVRLRNEIPAKLEQATQSAKLKEPSQEKPAVPQGADTSRALQTPESKTPQPPQAPSFHMQRDAKPPARGPEEARTPEQPKAPESKNSPQETPQATKDTSHRQDLPKAPQDSAVREHLPQAAETAGPQSPQPAKLQAPPQEAPQLQKGGIPQEAKPSPGSPQMDQALPQQSFAQKLQQTPLPPQHQFNQPVLGNIKEPIVQSKYDDERRPGYKKRFLTFDDESREEIEGKLEGSFNGHSTGGEPSAFEEAVVNIDGQFQGKFDGYPVMGFIRGELRGVVRRDPLQSGQDQFSPARRKSWEEPLATEVEHARFAPLPSEDRSIQGWIEGVFRGSLRRESPPLFVDNDLM